MHIKELKKNTAPPTFYTCSFARGSRNVLCMNSYRFLKKNYNFGKTYLLKLSYWSYLWLTHSPSWSAQAGQPRVHDISSSLPSSKPVLLHRSLLCLSSGYRWTSSSVCLVPGVHSIRRCVLSSGCRKQWPIFDSRELADGSPSPRFLLWTMVMFKNLVIVPLVAYCKVV